MVWFNETLQRKRCGKIKFLGKLLDRNIIDSDDDISAHRPGNVQLRVNHEIGDKVISTIYPEKEGDIVEINSIDGTKYYKVYWKDKRNYNTQDKDVKSIITY